MTDLLLAIGLLGTWGYLGWQWWTARRVTALVQRRVIARRQLAARRAAMEDLLARLQSPDPAVKVAAARELIRRRAAQREAQG